MLRAPVLVVLLLLSLIRVSQVYSVTESIRVEIYDEYIYTCSRDLNVIYTEEVRHRLLLDVFEASSGSHNITLALETDEELIYIHPSGPETRNHTVNDVVIIQADFEGANFFLNVGLNCSQSPIPDPFDIEILPSGLNTLPVDADGHLEFAFALNASEFVKRADLSIESPHNAENNIRSFSIDTSLNITNTRTYGGNLDLEISDIPKGNHTMQFRVRFAEVKGQIQLRLRVRKGSETYRPIRCFIDEEEIQCHKQINISYENPAKSFIRAGENWIYGYNDYSYYTIDFATIGRTLPLRIDRLSREIIDFIRIESEITQISVKETVIHDNPCFLLSFALKQKANVSIGLMVYDKVWFISSKNMSFDQIPQRIEERYTDPKAIGYPSPSSIDIENPLVQKWCEELVGEESNPYVAAFSLFQNLSSTLEYDKNLAGRHMLASEVLQNRRGVCAHYSLAYATLCAATGIPVRYIVGSVFRVEEFWKKNHAWNEVFLPGYGWVPVDVTWDFFGELPASHFLSTFWTYQNATLNVTKVQEPQIRWKHAQTLSDGLSFCEMKLEEVEKIRSLALWIPQGLDEVIDRNYNKLSKMETSVGRQCTHVVLISIVDILLSVNSIVPVIVFFAVVPPIAVISMALGLIFVRRKRIRQLYERYFQKKA